jgi:AcrR family transcriptional regulator
VKKKKPQVTRKPRRPQGGSLEKAVLEAYLKLSRRVGIAQVTLQKMADLAGVAFGTVRYYFATGEKAIHDEAFALVLQDSYRYIEEVLFEKRRGTKFNPIHLYVETMFLWAIENPEQGSYLIYMYYLSTTDVPLKTEVAETVMKARLRIESLLHEAIGKGLYKPVRDPESCAAHIHALTIGFGFIGLSFRNDKKFQLQKKLCIEAIDRLIVSDQTPSPIANP